MIQAPGLIIVPVPFQAAPGERRVAQHPVGAVGGQRPPGYNPIKLFGFLAG